MANSLLSWQISAGTRVYYVDVDIDKKGQKYVCLTEIPKNNTPGNKKRQRIFIHAEHIGKVVRVLTEAAKEIITNECD